MRQLVALSVLLGLAGGCDTSSDIRLIDDVMIVELTDERVLRLETESYDYCGTSIYVDSRARPGLLEIEVQGAERTLPMCDALIPGQWQLGVQEIPIDIRIRHRGETDLYRIDPDGQLEALEISTTRPGPRTIRF